MGLVRTVAPTATPISLDEVRQACRIDGADEDAYLAALTARAVDAVEKHIGRQICRATWVLRLDAFPPGEILLHKPPVAAVSSIVYVDVNGTNQTLAASAYQTDLANPDAPGRLAPAYGQAWPPTRHDTYNAVLVTFTCGWTTPADVPPSLKQALLFLVSHWYEERAPVNIGNITNALTKTLDYLLALDETGRYA